MKGSMRQRKPGVWELRVTLGRDPLPPHRVRQRSRTFRGTERKAQTALAAFVTETATERQPGTDGTFGLLLERWVEFNRPHWSPTTAQEYRRLIRKVIAPALGSVPLRRLTGEQLDALYSSETARGLSGKSVHQVHAVCRRALNQGVKWGWLPSNPAALTTPPPRRSTEATIPTVDQLRDLLGFAEVDDPQFAVMLRVAAGLGARRGELCGLRWSDIDGSRVTIRRAVIVVSDEATPGTRTPQAKTTKTHQNRRVTLDRQTAVILAAHQVVMQERADLEQAELVADAYVFSRDPDGSTPLRPGWVSDAFRRCADEVGLPADVHIHSLRHLFASLQLSNGVPVATVSKRLGHRLQSTTQNIYSHTLPDDDAVAAEALGRLLPGGSSALHLTPEPTKEIGS